MAEWMLCVTLNLLDPRAPVVCDSVENQETCTQRAEDWFTQAHEWEMRSQISVSLAAACWPIQQLLATNGEVHVHL